ncbi:MAG: primosomal protein N' [Planctomycetes bacterium]|nr:primosomal protein N' [Planctomycetota bacterium]
MPTVIQVAVFRPLDSLFDYQIPPGLKPQRGDLLEVPFGRTTVKGLCLKSPYQIPEPKEFKLKNIKRLYDEEYRLPEDLLKLGEWMRKYYLLFPGEVYQCLSFTTPLQKKSSIEAECTAVKNEGHKLKKTQSDALELIHSSPVTKPILLHGITGSGKTEVYLNLVEECLSKGQSCIYLLPEITLTKETMRKLKERFEPILMFHSGMSIKERRHNWLLAKLGGPYLIVGARSCLFTPIKDLGLIIVDEEHDSSFKQDSSPRYHARDLAVVRAHLTKCRIILGSATPSLESYRNAQTEKYQLVNMLERISPHPLPKVHVVDIGEERRELKRKGAIHFSRHLITLSKKAIMKKQQIIFFLNRRGFSTVALCPACGEKVQCPHCSVNLTYYKKKTLMLCHHCEFSMEPPKTCPRCTNPQMILRGTGTEKMHELVEQVFPNAKIVRVDGSIGMDKNIQGQLEEFMSGSGDILIGTQIISKGLDSPNIKLSAALNADLGLALPDFRSAERDFQLLTQLAGRTGRGDEPGECVFQTHEPEHYAIRHAIQQNYQAFYLEEQEYRQQLGYPPFKRLTRFIFSSSKEKGMIETLRKLSPILKKEAIKHHIELLGPAPAPIEKVKTKYRWHLIAKSASANNMTHFLVFVRAQFTSIKSVDFILDRDPQSMM